MSRTYTVAVLGATGAVGREMIAILEERRFPVGRLLPLASSRSAGRTVPFCGEEIPLEEATPFAFRGVDLVLGASPNEVAMEMAPHITAAGAIFVDNSSAFRLNEDVPLVVPEINPEDVRAHRGILANPNCSTIITLVAVAPLHRISPIEAMTVATYQAVSGAGAGGIDELREQVALPEGSVPQSRVFPYPIAYNLIPQIGEFRENGYTAEEMKLQNEGRKILHAPSLRVSCTCVRVPIVRSHSISATVVTREPISPDAARAAIAAAPGCRLVDNPARGVYPMPRDASGGDAVLVGRLRRDLTCERGLSLFCCGDQLRKGAATNAVQIAERVCGILPPHQVAE